MLGLLTPVPHVVLKNIQHPRHLREHQDSVPPSLREDKNLKSINMIHKNIHCCTHMDQNHQLLHHNKAKLPTV